jgi:hypothetical protein
MIEAYSKASLCIRPETLARFPSLMRLFHDGTITLEAKYYLPIVARPFMDKCLKAKGQGLF